MIRMTNDKARAKKALERLKRDHAKALASDAKPTPAEVKQAFEAATVHDLQDLLFPGLATIAHRPTPGHTHELHFDSSIDGDSEKDPTKGLIPPGHEWIISCGPTEVFQPRFLAVPPEIAPHFVIVAFINGVYSQLVQNGPLPAVLFERGKGGPLSIDIVQPGKYVQITVMNTSQEPRAFRAVLSDARTAAEVGGG